MSATGAASDRPLSDPKSAGRLQGAVFAVRAAGSAIVRFRFQKTEKSQVRACLGAVIRPSTKPPSATSIANTIASIVIEDVLRLIGWLCHPLRTRAIALAAAQPHLSGIEAIDGDSFIALRRCAY
jgi:hypothetical protein